MGPDQPKPTETNARSKVLELPLFSKSQHGYNPVRAVCCAVFVPRRALVGSASGTENHRDSSLPVNSLDEKGVRLRKTVISCFT